MFARVTGQQPRRPQLVRIAQFLRLATGEIYEPGLGLGRDARLLTRPRPVVECCQRTIGDRPLDAALDGLTMHPESPAHSEQRSVFPIRQQHARPLDPTCRFRRDRAITVSRAKSSSSIDIPKPADHAVRSTSNKGE